MQTRSELKATRWTKFKTNHIDERSLSAVQIGGGTDREVNEQIIQSCTCCALGCALGCASADLQLQQARICNRFLEFSHVQPSPQQQHSLRQQELC